MSRKPLFAAAALALLAGTALPLIEQATAQPAPSTQPGPSAQSTQPRPLRPSRIEGRLAFLKAELKITDAQAPQWNAFAEVMRQNEQARRQRFEQLRASRGQPATALERMERQSQLAEARNDSLKRFVAAFRPLYGSLSDDQKKAADELFAGRPHRGPGHHGRF